MDQLLVLFIGLPLLSFFVTLFWKNRNERPIGLVVRYTKVAYIILSVSYLVWWIANGLTPVSFKLATLYRSDNFVFALELFYDEITAVFSIVGALLFFLVATFSKYYMHRDQGYKRFFSTILLFAAGYNFIILSGNFETLFIGWEIKGLCSFLLIAFYWNRYLPVKNALKTVSNYRISDVMLMLAMWMMHHLTHRNISFTDLGEAKQIAAQGGAYAAMGVLVVCMIVLAATVKSAQFPFTSWLPRAMEGPTSSSAIFYGSLSVHIGIFLLLRTHPFWEDMLWAKILIIVTGVVTAVLSTLIARVQPTVKTQIAYSSAAQIGLMFIETAVGFHWLVLIHFAGTAFLRTYQLLVSPSVLNYLVHHQYFHYEAPRERKLSAVAASFYVLGVKEWNLDAFMFRFVWSPFKWIGVKLQFLQSYILTTLLVAMAFAIVLANRFNAGLLAGMNVPFPEILMSVALMFVLSSFSSRGSALKAWVLLLAAHACIILAIWLTAGQIASLEFLYYAGGIVSSFLLGYYCLQRIHGIDQDILLNRFHGYVYEAENKGLLFLLAVIGMLGFPITTAFVGIDVFFTHVDTHQPVLIVLLALCFLFIELAAFRILLRIFMGPHKKLYHPVAYRSS